jgi:hypothetical protein
MVYLYIYIQKSKLCIKIAYKSLHGTIKIAGFHASTIVQQMVVNLQLSELENNVNSFH